MKIITIAGEPATGKSYLMRGVIGSIGFIRQKNIDGIPCTILGASGKIAVLGQYYDGDDFGGTDRFSMSIQPKILGMLPELQFSYNRLIFEGDRLFNGKFLEAVRKEFELKVFFLQVSEAEKKERHTKRKDSQTLEWLEGRKSKLDYLIKYSNSLGNRYNITFLQNDDLNDLQENIRKVVEETR